MKFKLYTQIYFGIIFILILQLMSCDKYEDNIPNVYVNIQISLDDPDYTDLSAVGNSVYVTGGNKGIIICRISYNEFVAFDRTCSYDPNIGRVETDKTGIIVVDKECGSQFSLFSEGSVLKGPAAQPLKKYSTSYNPNTNKLYITNW